MNHQHLLTLAAVQQDERERKRRKAAAYLTLRELGEIRAQLRRMGEVLPEPPARSMEAFADAIYRLADESLTGQGQEGSGPDSGDAPAGPTAPSHLRLVRGLGEDPLPGTDRDRARRPARRRDMGGKPRVRSGESVPGLPRNFDSEEPW